MGKKDVIYTSLDGATGESGIQVVSKRKLIQTTETTAFLKEKFSRLEAQRLEKEGKLSEVNKKLEEKKNKQILVITHFNVFMYAACFFMQSGTLPYLTKKLGADPVTFGTLQTAFSVCQLLGGPIYGRIGDVMGERFAIILAFSSTTLTYLVTGLSYNIPTLFLSRIFSVLMHVMQGSQMVATSLSTAENRAGSLAQLGFSYGLGMVVGPSLGGLCTTNFGEQSSALLSALGSLFSLILVIIFVPQINKQTKPKESNLLHLKKMSGLIVKPEVRGLLLIKTICGIPIGILQSMFAVVAMEQFGLPADQNGFLMSYIGVLTLIMQGAGVALISSRISDLNIVKVSAVTLALSYLALSLLRGLIDFLILLAPLVFSLSLINSVISSTLTKVVSTEIQGFKVYIFSYLLYTN
ncbi:solute carrier family 22 member 18 isoform X2 [Eurytemora carolleeae]|uniref:solute carrier family 22 member 18 isoform X2 n=1 Tax=Eurytemora carolleeae TaxID=1294199 RepID=UPI000C75873A|nr:solute carrier family 22 member 18 isoform X2 [Eurytemora carolleeae]|eukprot:XP_023340071.1 solute carrier family 22 member 18-like isoform X2 [Eurytemora affinis]